MDTIILKSDILTVIKVNRKTKAKMFNNLKAGDKIQFSVPLIYAGRNGGSYATYVEAKNIETGDTTSKSFNVLPSILDSFDFE